MKTIKILGLLFSAGLALASVAAAQEAPAQPTPSAATADEHVMSNDELNGLSGGTGVTVAITDQTLTAVNTGNTITGTTIDSGQVNIGANAFSGYDGVGNFIINTGHNNNLQSSMNVTVVLAPPVSPGG